LVQIDDFQFGFSGSFEADRSREINAKFRIGMLALTAELVPEEKIRKVDVYVA
jgi:hypothetical protein